MNRNLFSIIAVSALIVPTLFSCKTTEANYRAAYEKTIAGREESGAVDSTIYGAQRRSMETVTLNTPDGDVEVRRQMVRITEEGGGSEEKLHRYNVVVRQFKQLFNAKSMRGRLAEGKYPSAFVIETAEPYYYVVIASYDDVSEARKALDEVRSSGNIVMREPLPFILEGIRRHRPL